MHRTHRRLAAAMLALTLGAALTACSADAPTTGTGATADAVEHDDADTQFAQMMIVHHEGAVEMAELAVERAVQAPVVELAERIEAAQDPEIDLMTGWLEEWGEPAEPTDHGGMDHGGMEMDGMSQEEVMAELEGLGSDAFDQRWLELMIAHHQGAVTMSEAQLEDGRNADALALAQEIVDAQTAEIEEMEALLAGG